MIMNEYLSKATCMLSQGGVDQHSIMIHNTESESYHTINHQVKCLYIYLKGYSEIIAVTTPSMWITSMVMLLDH